MNVLFYTSYHFNTETSGPVFENIQKHINAGDKVFILTCFGELPSCQVNPDHNVFKCKTCTSTFKNALHCLQGDYTLVTLQEIFPKENVRLNQSDITWDNNDIFRNQYYESFDIGMAVFSSIVSMYRDPYPNLLNYKNLVKNQWFSSMHVYEAVKKIIVKEKIELVYVFNARFATLRACLRASQHLNIDCNVLEEGRDRKSFSVFPNTMPHSFEFYTELINKTWEQGDLNKTEIALAYFDERSKSKNVRVGHFTKDQDHSKLPDSWDSRKINIVFFTSSEDEFVAIGKDWDKSLYRDQADAISSISHSLKPYENYKIYVRMHPNLRGILNLSIINVLKIDEKNVEIILPDSKVSSYLLLKNANIVITAGSSMGLEAAVFEKPSILTSASLYMNLDCTYNPSKHDELIEIILSDPKPKPKLGALKFGYMLKHFGINYHYFERINTFEGVLNDKKFGPDFLYLIIRKIGRWFRIKNENYIKNRNNNKIRKIYNSIHK